MYSLFWSSFLTFAGMWVCVGGGYCSTGQSRPEDPGLPAVNVTAFVVEYQITIIDRRYTMWAREDYDYLANKVRMTMKKGGREGGIIVDYNDNLTATYWYDDVAKSSYTCSIQELNTSTLDNFHLFGGARFGAGSMSNVCPTSMDIFSFGSSLDESYQGNTTIDGMPVGHWQSCIYWADDKANFTLDYYFTTPDWTSVDPKGLKQIPVRAVITGIKDTGAGTTYNISHIYDYFNFRVFPSLPEENFALPTDMKCDDPKGLRKKPLPRMPDRMSYTVEIVNEDVKMADVYYDDGRRLIRTSDGNTIVVDDFNTGVHYSIDKITQICTTRLISTALDSDAENSTRSVRVKGLQKMLNLDGDFTYTGQVDVRGIRCAAWVRTKLEQGVTSYVEVYFSLETEKFSNSLTGQVLVSQTVSSSNNVTVLNFFNQMTNPKMLTNPFDITLCRNESSKMDFRMVFIFSPEDIFQEHHQYWLIHDSLSSLVVRLTGVSPVQVHWADMQIDEVNKQLHWLGSFLAPDPDMEHAAVANSTSFISLSGVLEILRQLINDGHFITTVPLPAEGSDGPATLHLSALEVRNVSSDADFSDQSDVSLGHFIISYSLRPVNFIPEERVYAPSATSCADKCIQRSIYNCVSFSYCFSSNLCQLSSKSWINTTMTQASGCNFYSRDFTSDFTKLPGRTARPADQNPQFHVSSVQDCANLCLKKTDFNCESFDFCQSNDCYLGRYHYYENSSNDVHDATDCDHYSRDYVSDFDRSIATAFVVNNSPATDMVVVNNSSPSHCAYICLKDTVDCVMFSFCSSTLQCQIVSRSSITSLKTQPSPVCDVYTLKSSQTGRNHADRHGNNPAPEDDVRYSPESMAGLAIGMVIVGILLCLCIVFVLERFKITNIFSKT